MTVKIFTRRAPQEPPSTQFAATVVALPSAEAPGGVVATATAQAPAAADALELDRLATEGPPSQGGMPDLVTDVGGLPVDGDDSADAVDPAEAPTLSHIGRYALKRQLGVGGLGAVFEAWDPLLSRAVALKTLHLQAQDGPSQKQALDGLFLNEARAAAGLNHRYIVTIHDAGLSPHGVYIAMERLHGRDLQRALAEGWRPTVEQTVLLVRRIADALAYAHARGVVHCDIKPANIFLQRKDRPKVLDFGIARLIHGTGLPLPEGTVVGSPRYRAPEQLTGAPIDARTDLFSLGIVMFELLTGRRAFEGRSLAEIDRAVLQHDPPPAHELEPAVPLEISAMVARLMARDPAARYASAGELSADLRRWLHTQQPTAETVTMTALPRLSPPRRHTSAPAGAARGARGARAAAASRPARWLLGSALLLGAVTVVLGLQGRSRGPAAQALASGTAGSGGQAAARLAATAPGSADAVTTAAATAAAATGAALPPAAADPGAEPGAAPGHDSGAAAGLAVAGAPKSAADPTSSTARATAPAAGGARPAAASTGRARGEPTGRQRGTASAPPKAGAAADGSPAPRPSNGTLALAVSPWGEVEVDGKPAGTTPPLSRLNLAAGTHTITLRNADFPPHTVQVQVSGDKSVTLRHRFGS